MTDAEYLRAVAQKVISWPEHQDRLIWIARRLEAIDRKELLNELQAKSDLSCPSRSEQKPAGNDD